MLTFFLVLAWGCERSLELDQTRFACESDDDCQTGWSCNEGLGECVRVGSLVDIDAAEADETELADELDVEFEVQQSCDPPCEVWEECLVGSTSSACVGRLCSENEPCPIGYLCGDINRCTRCMRDGDCAQEFANWVCNDGVCEQGCLQDDACGENYCLAGRCGRRPCTEECPTGQRCDERTGTCAEGCVDQGNCPASSLCREYLCAAGPDGYGICTYRGQNEGLACDDGDDCRADDVCSDGTCAGNYAACFGLDCGAGPSCSGLRSVSDSGTGQFTSQGDLSADGRYLVFSTTTPYTATAHQNNNPQVYRYDQATGSYLLLSQDAAGLQAPNGCFWPRISDDGRTVAFLCTSLLPNDLFTSIEPFYWRDGVVDRVTGTELDQSCSDLELSGDGRYVVFRTKSTLLGCEGATDFIYRVELGAGAVCVSRGLNETAVNGRSLSPSISTDGSTVAFVSQATNLSTFSTEADQLVDACTLEAGEVSVCEPVSLSTAGQVIDMAAMPSLSGDGRYVAFTVSLDEPALEGKPAGLPVVAVRDLDAEKTWVATPLPEGSVGESGEAQLSDDGRQLVFLSRASHFDGTVASLTVFNVFVADLGVQPSPEQAPVIRRVSENGDTGAAFNCISPRIAADGDFVLFTAPSDFTSSDSTPNNLWFASTTE